MKYAAMFLIVLSSVNLIGCKSSGESNNSALSCTQIDFDPTEFSFQDATGEVSNLTINLVTGEVNTEVGIPASVCEHFISRQEVVDLINLLETGIHCSREAPAIGKNMNIKGDNVADLPWPEPSVNLTIEGGYEQFESDLKSLIREAEAQGNCTAAAQGANQGGNSGSGDDQGDNGLPDITPPDFDFPTL